MIILLLFQSYIELPKELNNPRKDSINISNINDDDTLNGF